MNKAAGFITLAYGKRYAEMAIDLALSVKEYHSEPISVLVDSRAARRIRQYQPNPFDKIVEVNCNVHPWGAKFLVGEACPYENAAFIDCDILFLRRTEFLEYSYTAPLAMYGAYMPPEADFQTYYHSREIFTAFGLSRYFWATSGIFLFRRSESKDFFRACLDFYRTGINEYPRFASDGLADELVFGVMSDQYPIESIQCATTHPWPMAPEMMTIEASCKQWPVIHIFGPVNSSYMDHLMNLVERRRVENEFALRSKHIWESKAQSVPTAADKLRHLAKRIKRFTKSKLSP